MKKLITVVMFFFLVASICVAGTEDAIEVDNLVIIPERWTRFEMAGIVYTEAGTSLYLKTSKHRFALLTMGKKYVVSGYIKTASPGGKFLYIFTIEEYK